MDAVRNAGAEFVQACRKLDPSYSALDPKSLRAVERYVGREVPEPWRSFLLEYGCGAKDAHFDLGSMTRLSIDPMNAAEHQVETDVGQQLAAQGKFVIGYFDGLGDCLTINADAGHPDPTVSICSTSGDERPWGSLSVLLLELTAQLRAQTPQPRRVVPKSTPLMDKMRQLDLGGSAEGLEALIEQRVDLDTEVQLYGGTTNPLVYALGKESLFVSLIEAGADPLKALTNGECAFHRCSGMTREMVALVLRKYPQAVNVVNAMGQTPLMLTLQQGSSAIEDLLYTPEAQLDVPDARGKYLLHYLCETHSRERLAQGIRAGVRKGWQTVPDNVRHRLILLFVEAAAVGDIQMIDHCLEIGVHVDERLFGRETAISSARRKQQHAVVEKLLALGADPNLDPDFQ